MLLQEERRLYYVAMTRAKDELFLITEVGNESQFINEIPKELFTMRTANFGKVIMLIPLCETCGTERKPHYNYCPTCGFEFAKETVRSPG
jgi:DNA helicase-4